MLSPISSNQINNTISTSNPNKINSTQDNSSNSFQLALKESSNVKELEEVSNKEPSVEALANFYEIHQRSQITGVPTNEYNKAVQALGVDISQPFFQNKAIELLNAYDFNTDFPTKEAVLKYGNTNQDSGNRAYMIGNDKFVMGEMFSKAQDNIYDEFVQEIKDEINVSNNLKVTSNSENSQMDDEQLAENIIDSIVPSPIVLDDEEINQQINTEKLISTLELLMSSPNVVNNDVKQSMQNTLDFLNTLDQ